MTSPRPRRQPKDKVIVREYGPKPAKPKRKPKKGKP